MKRGEVLKTDELFTKFLNDIQTQVSQNAYTIWFSKLELLSIVNNVVTIKVPMEIHKQMLSDTYADIIDASFFAMTGINYTFKYITEDEVETFVEPVVEEQVEEKEIEWNTNLNPKFTFDNYPVDIYPPDFNLRCEIIRSKVKNTSIENKLNDDVIEYIANSCVNDVRHIEGTINRLLAYTAMMVPDKITLDFANEALNDYVNTNIFINNSISSIQSAVAEYFKISVDDLKSKRRTNTVVKPRHIAMYLCRVETDENLMKIGLEFGGRDHSTVSTACDKIKEELEKNPNLNNVIKDIKMKLQ